MPDESRLIDLIVRWDELQAAGQNLLAEQLCQDCPELIPALQKRTEALQIVNAAVHGLDANEGTVSQSPGDSVRNPERGADGVVPTIPGYEILRELGRGGMGVVYQARQAGMGRLVALKMLLAGEHAAPSQRDRFQAEVEAIGRLQHPNLVQVFEVGAHEGRAFFSMEYVDGGTLEQKIAAGPQTPRQAAEMVEILARAIHAAHERGIVHRDLKPANVLLTSDGTPKISDFGLAKRLDVATGPTLTQHVLGTPSYMAPEQARGQSKHVGPATDVYSLGAILYEMLTGRPPFQSGSVVEMLRQVTDEEPIPPRRLRSNIPVDLETICAKCLSKQPAQRYASAAALADDLHRFLAGEPIVARPIGSWQRLAMWVRRRPALASLFGVIGLALLAALVAGWWFTQRLTTELHKTDQARRELEESLARQVAEGLDSDLGKLESVPEAAAALLSQREDWTEAQLELWMRTLVIKYDRIFGLCAAFEPRQFDGPGAHENYCLYVYETGLGQTATKRLVPPDYPAPSYRERPWYTAPKLARRATWSEPYIGQGADNTAMVTYSVPIVRAGKFSGVVAADISMKYFRQFHNDLRKLYLGPDSYSFVITPNGTFVYHPDRRYEFPSPTSSLDRIQASPDFLDLMRRMQPEKTGRGRAMDFTTGRPATFLFALIPTTGWHFVVVHADPG